MKPRSDPARLGVLIYDDVEPIDIGGTVGVVSMARRVLPQAESAVIARQPGPVRLAGGHTSARIKTSCAALCYRRGKRYKRGSTR